MAPWHAGQAHLEGAASGESLRTMTTHPACPSSISAWLTLLMLLLLLFPSTKVTHPCSTLQHGLNGMPQNTPCLCAIGVSHRL
jgi:hypothetical protein